MECLPQVKQTLPQLFPGTSTTLSPIVFFVQLPFLWDIFLTRFNWQPSPSILLFLQTEEKKSPEPLFLAEMELLEPDIIFRPSLNKAIFNNFFTIFTGLIEDIFQMAELVPRIHKVE